MSRTGGRSGSTSGVRRGTEQQHPAPRRPGSWGGPGRRRRVPALARGRPLARVLARSAANIGKVPRRHRSPRSACKPALSTHSSAPPGVTAMVMLSRLIEVRPGPLVGRDRHEQPAAGCEHPADLAQSPRLRAHSARPRRTPQTRSKAVAREGEFARRGSRTPRRQGDHAGRCRGDALRSPLPRSQPTLGPSALPTSRRPTGPRRGARARSARDAGRRYHQ